MANLARCPACSCSLKEDRGYYLCPEHGVIPYDWIKSSITQDKALDMMAKWGIEVIRKRQAATKAKVDAAPVKGDVAELLSQLKVATSPVDKRKLRAALRKAGHVGGLHA